MTDPTYSYVKGKGWVASVYPQYKFTDLEGKEWYLIPRKPEVGEVWDAYREPKDIDEYIEELKNCQLCYWSGWQQSLQNNFTDYEAWYVFIPVTP